MLKEVLVRLSVCAFACCLAITAHAMADQKNHVSVPAGDLTMGLETLAKQTGAEFVFSADQVRGLRTRGVSGELSAQEAVTKLLIGTPLELRMDPSGAMLIAPTSQQTQADGQASQSPEQKEGKKSSSGDFRVAQVDQAAAAPTTVDKQKDQKKPAELEEVVVTGTTIHGVSPSSSPLTTYDAQYIASTGAATVEEFVAKLPQNLNSIPGVAAGAFGTNANVDAAVGINLHGVGDGTTLVLLNGRRIAPASQSVTPDISMIPLSAVDHVEVLTDGASAIYGADAVGGVVNFVMKERVEGAHTSVEGAVATQGGLHDMLVNQDFGHNWSSGDVLLAYSYFDRSSLDASDRSFSKPAEPYSLYPADRRNSAFLTLRQQLPQGASLFADALYSWRDTSGVFNDSAFGFTDHRDTAERQGNVNLGAAYPLNDRILATVQGSYSSFDLNYPTLRTTSAGSTEIPGSEGSSTLDLTAKIDGTALQLPTGDLKFSLGGGYTKENYRIEVTDVDHLGRDTRYGFGELLVPIVRTVELSLAGRYTDYSDFGSKFSPKAGLSWKPIASLNVRGSYGESYRAPPLEQIDASVDGYSLFPLSALGLPDHFSNNNSTVLFYTTGDGNPSLKPETSKSYTFGFDLKPVAWPRFKASVTYFNVDFKDRIAVPDPSSGIAALNAPGQYPSVFTVNPTAAQIAPLLQGAILGVNLTGANPTDAASIANAVTLILNDRSANVARSRTDGLDFDIADTVSTAMGDLGGGLSGTYLLRSTYQLTATSPSIDLLGTVLNSPKFRGRAYVRLTNGGFSGQANVNYVSAFSNPLTTGAGPVSSWTTVDLVLSYEFRGDTSSVLGGVDVSLTAQNLFDRSPPFVPVGTTMNQTLNVPIGFDPINANALGRYLALQLRKKW